jgi:uncharacterized sulfatase
MGTTTERLVSFVDFGPTVLSLAGVEIPRHMQGEPFLGRAATRPREYVYGLRDRMDERYDIIRSVRDQRYKYIRNYRPDLPYAQHLNYAEQGPTLQSIRRLHSEGTLPQALALFMSPTKPPEELYDTENDPYELKNLAESPEHRSTLERLRQAHVKWMEDTLDLALVPEPELRARSRGSNPYELVRRADNTIPLKRLREAAVTAQQGEAALSKIADLLKHDDAAVRYWGCIGLASQPKATSASEAALAAALSDASGTVRVAAADALVRLDRPDKALSVLVAGLSDDNEWVRLAAMHGLDRLEDKARPALAEIKRATSDSNGYVGRVAEHALKTLGESAE